MHALALSLALSAAPALTPPTTKDLDPAQISFVYQSNVEPWSAYTCKHVKAATGFFDWDVYCKVDAVVKKYSVHLLVNFYAKTVRGKSAYEVLYWVTDWSNSAHPASDSTTLWVHNTEEKNRATAFELAQGVEDDMSSLRLDISL